MKIAITGGSGFIGTNVLWHFISMATVINIDFQYPRDKSLLEYWKQIDITNLGDTVKTMVEFNPDYIIHLAARTDLSGENIQAYDANTIGVRNVLAAASQCRNLKKILITSSMLVCRTGYLPKDQFDWCPSTYYGESKVETEKIVWENKPECDWAILRPTSMWGPWFGEPYRHFFDMVKNGTYFHIGHKLSTKTYGYVENAVYQIERILFSSTEDENNKVFYLGDRPATFIEDWADEIAEAAGKKVIRVPYVLVRMAAWLGDILNKLKIPFPMYSFRLTNMMTDNIIDLDNTYSIAPNPPFTRIEGTKKTIDWMASHPEI